MTRASTEAEFIADAIRANAVRHAVRGRRQVEGDLKALRVVATVEEQHVHASLVIDDDSGEKLIGAVAHRVVVGPRVRRRGPDSSPRLRSNPHGCFGLQDDSF